MKYINKQKYLIITSDDFGMCPQVNEAILKCIDVGLVSSINVIVNLGDFSEASSIRTRFPHVSIGIHWNVTSGRPKLQEELIPSLINPETHEFWSVTQFQSRMKKRLINLTELRNELIEQYNCFKTVCGHADYWNTHQNSALSFGLFNIFNDVALDLGITYSRSFRRVYVKTDYLKLSFKSKIFELFKRIILECWFKFVIPRNGTKLPEGRIIYFNENTKTESLANIGENILWQEKRIVELVIHPATTTDHMSFGTISNARVQEYKLFSNKDTLNYLKSIGVTIVNFDILKGNYDINRIAAHSKI